MFEQKFGFCRSVLKKTSITITEPGRRGVLANLQLSGHPHMQHVGLPPPLHPHHAHPHPHHPGYHPQGL